MSRGYWVGAVVVALAGLGAAAAAFPFHGDVAIPVFVVADTRFAHEVQAEGNLKEAESTPLAVPLDNSGPFKIEWLPPDGTVVHEGEIVVRFDANEVTRRIADGRTNLATAASKLSKANEETTTRLANLDRDATQARRELDAAERPEKMDREIYSRSAIVEAGVDATLAQAREAHAKGLRVTHQSLAKTEVDLIGIESHKAELKLEQAAKTLAAVALKAPHDGVLLIERDWRGNQRRAGDSAWSGQVIARIPKLDKMDAEVYVLEADAGGLAIGQSARVRLEALPGQVFVGKVKRVDSLAKPRVKGVPMQYFGATLELDKTDPATMKPGARVQATILLNERAAALVVPRQAVFDKDGTPTVYRKDGRGFTPVTVTLGPASPGRVVIDKGIAQGDTLALRDPTAAAAPARNAAPAAAGPGGAS